MTRLLLGLLAHAARWHLQPRWLLTCAGYRLRPYCYQLDARHVWWRHRHCTCVPDIVFELTVDTSGFDKALARAVCAHMRSSR